MHTLHDYVAKQLADKIKCVLSATLREIPDGVW